MEPPLPTAPIIKKRKREKILKRVLSIRLLIIFVVVLLVAIASIISWVTQHFIAQNGINDLGAHVRDLIRAGVQVQVQNSLQDAAVVARIDNGTFTYAVNNISRPTQVTYLKHLYRLTQASSAVGAISYADTFGNQLSVRASSVAELENNVTQVPFLYAITANGHADLYEVAPNTINLGRYLSSYNFDPLTRPWYLLGENNTDGNYLWTGVSLNTQDVLIVSLSQPFYADGTNNSALVGVLGVHVYLSRLKQLLTNITVFSGSVVLLIDEQGLMIADSCALNGTSGLLTTCPELQDPNRADFNTTALPSFKSSTGDYKDVADALLKEYGSFSTIPTGQLLIVNGLWVTAEAVRDSNLRWTALIMIQIESYMGKVNQANKYTILASALFIVASVIVAFFASFAITSPISRTIAQMDRISNLDFGDGSERRKKKKCVSKNEKNTK